MFLDFCSKWNSTEMILNLYLIRFLFLEFPLMSNLKFSVVGGGGWRNVIDLSALFSIFRKEDLFYKQIIAYHVIVLIFIFPYLRQELIYLMIHWKNAWIYEVIWSLNSVVFLFNINFCCRNIKLKRDYIFLVRKFLMRYNSIDFCIYIYSWCPKMTDGF